MNLRFLTLARLFAATTFAADAPKLPAIPTEPIAKKQELLFSDDFERAELSKDKGWTMEVPTFPLENGTLKGRRCASMPPRRMASPQ